MHVLVRLCDLADLAKPQRAAVVGASLQKGGTCSPLEVLSARGQAGLRDRTMMPCALKRLKHVKVRQLGVP